MHVVNDPINPLSPASVSLAKNMLTALAKHYPGVKEGWTVMPVENQGIVQVTNSLLSGKMGFVLHVVSIDEEMRSVIRAGGELLERYNVLRHPALSKDEILKHTKFNRVGQMVHEK